MKMRRFVLIRSVALGLLALGLLTGMSGEGVTESVMGILYGKQEVTLKAKTQGEISEVRVAEGDAVKSGDVLAVIEDKQKNIEYDIAKVEFENAKHSFQRIEKLDKYVSREERDQKKANYLTKKSMFELKEMAVAHTRIVSTIDGVVAKKYLEKSQTVAVGDKVFDVVQLDELTLKTHIPAIAAKDLSVGSEVQFKTDFHKARIFKGVVAQMSPVIEAVSNTVRVFVTVKNPKNTEGTTDLRPGMVVTLLPSKQE